MVWLALNNPVLEELYSPLKILYPRLKRLERWISVRGPYLRYLIVV